MSEHMRNNIHRFRLRRSPPPLPPGAEQLAGDSPRTRSPRSVPACERCRHFKKRCSRTFPVCALCANSGHPCSLSTQAQSSLAQTHHLKARIEWLSQIINQHVLPETAPVESFDTGTDLKNFLRDNFPAPVVATLTPNQNPPSLVGPIADSDIHPPQALPDHNRHTSVERRRDSSSSISSHGRNQEAASIRRFLDAYFQHVNRAYPFVDRARIFQELEKRDLAAPRPRNDPSILLELLVAIGFTTLQRAGQLPDNAILPVTIEYASIINHCLSPRRIESVQILVLLAIYSFFDPEDSSAWSVVGIASRQAVMLGISRRPSNTKALSSSEAELCYRLYWSIFVLDRMTACCFGLPFTLTDSNADVPLPGLTIEEFASPERPRYASILQTNRHVIQLRKIEGDILSQIHFRRYSEIARLSHGDRRTILRELRSDIDTWYSNGSLVSPQTADNVGIHDSIIWSSARYYHLLLLLHYPCPFNSFNSGVSTPELMRFAQKHLQSTSALLQGRQLPLNWPTLSRLLPVGLILLHGSIASATIDGRFPEGDEVNLLVKIFDAFPDAWSHARRASGIFQQFNDMISSYSPLLFSSTVFNGDQANGNKDSFTGLFLPVINSLVSLMEDVLGKGTTYIFHEFPEETPSCSMSVATDDMHANFPPAWPPPNPITGTVSNEELATEIEWGSMGLGYL
ncbi:hypothetical protein BS50DRAFT_608826 [Corynespora cassiicola Philippines]|uniref:Zn(2)-C6 fungal-type domain-containing protein n=1 Tax=Corynespora cassiicola Philippines TaxID=1448308 RepID=A0A2T2NYA4_CORCC|nr:hypothetical protein BS50DRAFT_608826 [Corynespora cassiicola Philippines]